MPLARLLRQSRVSYPEGIALCHGEQSMTYAELDRVTDRLAGALAGRGIEIGDRIAFLLPNCPELAYVDFACFKIGAAAVPLNTRLAGGELAYILNHCRARICIVHADLYPVLEAVKPDLPLLETVYLVGAHLGSEQSFDRLLSEPIPDFAPPVIPDDAVAAILYTSGTTARPKGVTHSHRSLGNTVSHYVSAAGLDHSDVVLGMLSMAHIFGFALQLLSPLSVGACVAIAPRNDADCILELLARHRVTHLYGLPVMFDALVNHPQTTRSAASHLRYCLAGGDAVPTALAERAREVLGVEIHEGCGMTEVIPYALNRPALPNRPGSIGKPSVGMQLRLESGRGETLGDDMVGEILVSSDALMVGYWEDPLATSHSVRDGWFHTGDLGRRDQDGYYWFVGRSKEIIVRGGSNISPLEVESALSGHPAVREIAVVGTPHPVLGEVVWAFVVLHEGKAATEAELKNFSAGRIAAYKIPETIKLLPELPRGATGKVHRKTLREMAMRAEET